MDIKRQERAPIYEALEEFKKKRVVPFDVPGHKRGRGNPELVHLLGEKCVGLDVNSMKPLDNLCHPVSVIREAEELAADAFGAANAFLMVGGTTSAVQAMILSTCKAGDKIILPRNVHKSALNALVLCGAIPVYVNPQTNAKLGISLGMEIDQVARAIEENPDAKAVLVNNPTYYGICSDLKSIVALAHSKGIKQCTLKILQSKTCEKAKPLLMVTVHTERSSCPCFAAALSGSPTESVRSWRSISFRRLM